MSVFVQQHLSQLDPEKEFSENRTADILGVSNASLARRRERGTAMPHRIEERGRACVVFYRVADILQELDQYGHGGRR